MKKILALLLAAMMLLPGLAMAEEAELKVIGQASVSVTPDMACVSVGVQNKAATVEQASADNAKSMDALIEALKEIGVMAGDLSTENYYVSIEYDYDSDELAIEGYVVNNTLNVLIRDTEKVGMVIDQAIAAGANHIYGVEFLSSAEKSARDEALTLAVQEGMRKASLLAMAAGKQLGSLESVEENESYGYMGNAAYDAKMLAAGTSIMAENLTVTATVTLVYELR